METKQILYMIIGALAIANITVNVQSKNFPAICGWLVALLMVIKILFL